jgi:hypothetical protein
VTLPSDNIVVTVLDALKFIYRKHTIPRLVLFDAASAAHNVIKAYIALKEK